jgi:hypothetical protein
LREKTLDRTRRPVSDGSRRVDCDPADALPERLVDGGRRSLLHDLLMPPLDGAVALAEMDHVPVSVAEHLHLDVAGVIEVALDVDVRVGEVRLTFATGGIESPLHFLLRACDPESFAAAPGRRLDRDRKAGLLGYSEHLRDARRWLGAPGDDGYTGRAHAVAGGDLGPHRLDRIRRRPDPYEPDLFDRTGE